jgi:hypothetical protein
MSQKLQLDADLTLESAKTKVREREALREQQVQLKSAFQEEGLPVEAIGNRGTGVCSETPSWKGEATSYQISRYS